MSATPTRAILFSSAIFGVLVAALARFMPELSAAPIARVVVLAVMGVTPLSLAALPKGSAASERALRSLAYAQIPFSVTAVASFFLDGAFAAAASAAWLLFTIALALFGIMGALDVRGGSRDPAILMQSFGLLLVPVGAAWLFASRADMRPWGTSRTLVILAAVHFHFIGLAVPVIVGRVIQHSTGRARRLALGCAIAVVVGIPLVAIGITWSPVIAFGGAVLLAGALFFVALLMLGPVQSSFRRKSSRGLLLISGLSIFLSMTLAVVYAYGQVVMHDLIGIDSMVRIHGYANAHGVVTCGLFAFVLEDRVAPAR